MLRPKQKLDLLFLNQLSSTFQHFYRKLSQSLHLHAFSPKGGRNALLWRDAGKAIEAGLLLWLQPILTSLVPLGGGWQQAVSGKYWLRPENFDLFGSSQQWRWKCWVSEKLSAKGSLLYENETTEQETIPIVHPEVMFHALMLIITSIPRQKPPECTPEQLIVLEVSKGPGKTREESDKGDTGSMSVAMSQGTE